MNTPTTPTIPQDWDGTPLTVQIPVVNGASFPLAIERVENAAGDGESTDRVRISTETPLEFYGWELGLYDVGRCMVIMSHEDGAIDLRRFDQGGVSFLRDHDPRLVDGILRNPAVKGRALWADLTWSDKPDSQLTRADVAKGVRPHVSPGWLPRALELVSEKNGISTYRATQWEVLETSSVSIPRDRKSGINKNSAEPNELHACVITMSAEARKEGTRMPPDTTTDTATPATPAAVVTNAAPVVQPAQPVAPVRNRQAEIMEIVPLARAAGLSNAKVDAIVAMDLPTAQSAVEILKASSTANVANQPGAEGITALNQRDRDRYSYRKAILEFATNGASGLTGVEKEVHQEFAKNGSRGGLVVPLRINPEAAPVRNTMTSIGVGVGAEAVFDRPGEMIDMLKNKAKVALMGARILPGLTTPVPFLKKTSAPTLYWVGENPASGVTASDIGTGLVTLVPKTAQARCVYSRQQLLLASIDNEAMVRGELADAHALGVDYASLHGLGAAGEPTGVYYMVGVQTEAMGGVPSYQKLVKMVGKVADANAADGSLGFLTTSLMAAEMMVTPEHTTAQMAGWCWRGNIEEGVMAGYPARSTNQVSKTMSTLARAGGSEHGIIFGNWAQLVIGLYGVVELVVDPYTLADKGLIAVNSFQMADVIARQPTAFCVATGATVTA